MPSSGLWLVLDALGLELIAAARCCHTSLSSGEWPSFGMEVGFPIPLVDFSGETSHLVRFCLEILPDVQRMMMEIVLMNRLMTHGELTLYSLPEWPI